MKALDFSAKIEYNTNGGIEIMKKLYKDRDWLWEHYIVRGESSCIMAREAWCSSRTIRNWLHEFGIPIRGYNGLWQDRNWLWEKYIVQKESTHAMAKEAGCAQATILRCLHRNEFPARNCNEGISLATGNSVNITPKLLEFMRGEIVGDGYVGMRSNYSACYQHTSKYEKYVAWLSGLFAEWGIKQSGGINRYKDKKTGAITYRYESRCYPELVPIYKRWYPNGKKIVPQDLVLTPIMTRQWYLGDGGLDGYMRKRPGIRLCTCDFDRQSINHLIKELNRLGFKATHQPSTNSIRIWVHSVPDFLKWIGPCPVSCYDYKWDYDKNA